MSVLGQLTGPVGKLGARVYTVTKSTVKGASEGVAMYARGKEGYLAEEGSASVIAERAGIGFGKGVAKVGVSQATPARRWTAWRSSPAGRSRRCPTCGNASVVSVIRDTVTGAGGGVIRRAVGVAVSKRWAAEKVTPR